MALQPFYQSFFVTPSATLNVLGTPFNITLPTVPASQSGTLPSPQVPIASGFLPLNYRVKATISSADTLTVALTYTFGDGTTFTLAALAVYAGTTSEYWGGTTADTNRPYAVWNLANLNYPANLAACTTIRGPGKSIVSASLSISSSVNSSASTFAGIFCGLYDGTD